MILRHQKRAFETQEMLYSICELKLIPETFNPSAEKFKDYPFWPDSNQITKQNRPPSYDSYSNPREKDREALPDDIKGKKERQD